MDAPAARTTWRRSRALRCWASCSRRAAGLDLAAPSRHRARRAPARADAADAVPDLRPRRSSAPSPGSPIPASAARTGRAATATPARSARGDDIHAAQTALPSGPVTHGKAWIEMIHRYLATAVGVLITVLALASWLEHRRSARRGSAADVSPWWATATLVWVCVQGAFGALTVTMKLYPAIVTAHLLGGVGAARVARRAGAGLRSRAAVAAAPARTQPRWPSSCSAWLQIALGGWVSTNYAVLACTDFPACQGSWWPAMDFRQGFALLRELGRTADGALAAVRGADGDPLCSSPRRLPRTHGASRCSRGGWQWPAGPSPTLRRWALGAGGRRRCGSSPAACRTSFLGWPLAAAVAHTGGAAALVAWLTVLLTRARQARRLVTPWPAQTSALASASRPRFLESPHHVASPVPAQSAEGQRGIAHAAVLRAHQAAGRAADRLLCRHRHAAGRARAGPTGGASLPARLGIWLVAAAAAAFNCLVEQQIDARMARTAGARRPRANSPTRRRSPSRRLLCAIGSALLYLWSIR